MEAGERARREGGERELTFTGIRTLFDSAQLRRPAFAADPKFFESFYTPHYLFDNLFFESGQSADVA
jgi:hypothetical protein